MKNISTIAICILIGVIIGSIVTYLLLINPTETIKEEIKPSEITEAELWEYRIEGKRSKVKQKKIFGPFKFGMSKDYIVEPIWNDQSNYGLINSLGGFSINKVPNFEMLSAYCMFGFDDGIVTNVTLWCNKDRSSYLDIETKSNDDFLVIVISTITEHYSVQPYFMDDIHGRTYYWFYKNIEISMHEFNDWAIGCCDINGCRIDIKDLTTYKY